MKRNVIFSIFVFSLLLAQNNLFAQRGTAGASSVVEVRLASPLPRNSDWGRGLDRLSAEWARVTNNQVRLRVIHDGLEGSESKMLSSLNTDNIQAALFISSGLLEICPSVMTLSVPFMIKDNNELDVVLKDVLPVLDNQMGRTNFVSITWAKAGWVNFFTKDSVLTPDELRRQRIGSNPELKELNTVFRTMGFQIVETDITDIGTRLANNMINGIYLIPEAIAPLGLHRYLSNMLDMSIAPLLGAVVMNRVTWNKISPAHQAELIRVTKSIVAEFETSMTRTSANAITAMQRDGLKLNKLTQAQEEVWRSEINSSLPLLLGTTYDRNLYNQINEILERVRSRQ